MEDYAAENGAGAVLLVDAPDRDFTYQGALTNWISIGGLGNYYGLGMLHYVFDEWGIPGLGTVTGHGGSFNSQAFYWPEQNVTIIGTLNSNEPQFGFVFLMIDVMAAMQELAVD